MTVKGVKLKSESFFSIPFGVMEENSKGGGEGLTTKPNFHTSVVHPDRLNYRPT